MVYRKTINIVALFAVCMALWLVSSKPLTAQQPTQPETTLSDSSRPTIWLSSLEGPIGPALSDYVVRALARADQQAIEAIVLRINTPGGLDSSMRDIIESILASPIPVIGYVSPRGARAASAGTYILYATHVAAMAPATTLGAATPVQISPFSLPDKGGDVPSTEEGKGDSAKTHPTIEDKVISDAVAYIRGLAQLRNRNVEWAIQAVTDAASLSADEALRENVVDLIANDVDELLTKIDGSSIQVLGRQVQLDTSNAIVETIAPDWRTELLAVITNPTVAYILLMIGIYGLILEFWSPGSIGPGIVGGICLLLGLYALQFLPVNYTGLALIALGVAFMMAEAFMPSFGVVGIGGLVAFVVGSVMLLDTDVPGFTVSPWVIGALAVTGASAFLTVLVMFAKARKRPVVSGPEQMLGSIGEVIHWQNDDGRVRVHGEIWQATAKAPLESGDRVRVAGRDGLVLMVQAVSENSLQENIP